MYFLLTLILFLVACSGDNDSGSSTPLMTSRICSDRVIDSLNPPSEVVVFGNSLVLGNGTFGLSASDSTQDFFFKVDSAFRHYNPDCATRRILAKQIENSVTDSVLGSGISENIVPYISSSTDLVIVQLGDNIDLAEEVDRMETTVSAVYDSICNKAKQAKVVWVGEWYWTEQKQNILREQADRYGAQFIDISDLYTVENQGRVGDVTAFSGSNVQSVEYESYSTSGDTLTITFLVSGERHTSTIVVEDYKVDAEQKRITITGHQGLVVDEAVASHPGDLGFRLIAQRILSELGF